MLETPDEFLSPVEALVHKTIKASSPGRVLVGFSGGIDSTALLLAAHAVTTAHYPDIKVQALHVNHGLQTAAKAWQIHCEQVCASLHVTCHVLAAEVSSVGNVEANARNARYQLFAEHVGPNDLLLLGHHQQDQTETILYRLFQGRGLMPMRNQGRVGEGQFARPLLALAQSELGNYVRQHGLTWIEDHSNADTQLARNFLRHEIVPLLQTRWQHLHRAIERVVSNQAGITEALLHEVAKYPDAVPLSALPSSPPARLAWLRAYLHSRQVYTLADRALAEFSEQLKGVSLAHLSCSAETSLYGYAHNLHFVREFADTLPTHLRLRLGQTVTLARGQLALVETDSSAPLAFSYPGPLRVGFRQGGERLGAGAAGSGRSVKQIFNEAKVPPWRRSDYPLLFAGDQLVCVPGLAVSTPAIAATGPVCLAIWTSS